MVQFRPREDVDRGRSQTHDLSGSPLPITPRPLAPAPDPAAVLELLTELAANDGEPLQESEQLAPLTKIAEVCSWAPGEVLFREGDASDAVYLIISGEVEVDQQDGDQPHLLGRSHGEFVGEIGVVENQPRSATVTARTEVQALRFSKDAFLSLVSTAPFLVWKLVRNISARLRQREKEYLEKLQTRNRELAEAAARLQEMNGALEQLVAQRTRELAEANRRLETLAITDHLTGLYNRRFLHQIVEHKATAILQSPRPFAVMMIDVDHFKQYNDRNGHMAGDDVLRTVGELLRGGVRASDIVARYGGEEFCIILENVLAADAVAIAEKLRRLIMAHPIPHAEFQPLGKLTISVGIAVYPEDADGVRETIQAADDAMYLAKEAGRNRVAARGSGVLVPDPL